jgi:GTP-binding protein Era
MQVVFVDTPGIHKAQHKLGDYMNEAALESISDADMVLWLLDASEPLTNEDRIIAEKLSTIRRLPSVYFALTKVDLVSDEKMEEVRKAALELYPAKDMLEISSFNKKVSINYWK